MGVTQRIYSALYCTSSASLQPSVLKQVHEPGMTPGSRIMKFIHHAVMLVPCTICRPVPVSLN